MKSKIIFHKKGGPLGYFEKWQKFQKKKIFSKTHLISIKIDFRPFLEKKKFFANFQNILRVPPSYEKIFCQKKLFHYFSHTHRSPTKGLVQKKSQLSGWKTLITTFFETPYSRLFSIVFVQVINPNCMIVQELSLYCYIFWLVGSLIVINGWILLLDYICLKTVCQAINHLTIILCFVKVCVLVFAFNCFFYFVLCHLKLIQWE